MQIHTTFLRAALCALGCATLVPAAWAQEGDAGLPLWEAGVFAGALSTPSYPASQDRATRSIVLPVLIYRGEILRSDRDGVGARLYRSDNLQFDIGFAASLPASSDESTVRKGMPDLGTLIEFGPRLNLTLARPAPGARLQLELPVRAVLELGGGVRRQGYAIEPQISYEMRDLPQGWSLNTSVGVVWGDAELNRFFYGVAPAYATATRPAYEAQPGLIATRLSVSTSKVVTPDVRVFAYARQQFFDASANRASPLYQQSTGQSVGVGLVWMLGRSESKVPG
jgi:outer membrane scaffolding protein for murein synthesis (MipA/OmpV family)